MSGIIGDLSASQESALASLRERLADEIKTYPAQLTDVYLLRFLRSRQFDLDKTEAKLRATLEFKKRYGAFTILESWTPPPLCVKYFPSGFLPGLDNEGRVMNLLCLGNVDPKGFLKSHSKEELIKYKVYLMERVEKRIRDASAKTGKPHDTVVALLDLYGLSAYHLWKPGVQLIADFLQIEEMHYPELAHKVIVLRAPRIFPTIYALLKSFIDPNTRKKIEVPAPSGALNRLLEFTTLENIPEAYGGKLKETPDACWGGKIPKEFYKENDDSLQHQYVKPGKSFSVEVLVEAVPQQIVWDFVTENHDIGFSVLRGEEVVVSSQRFQSHQGNVEGSFVCEQTGTYTLFWDNSFSWARGKNLRYTYSLAEYHEETNFA